MPPQKREAAGIVPYIKREGKVYFLLGRERFRDNLLCGFVGGREPKDKTLVDTAIREFNEETCLVFNNSLDFIRNKITHDTINTKCFKTQTQRSDVTVWFVLIPSTHDMRRDEREFLLNLSMPLPEYYKEKSSIMWIDASSLENSELSHPLRKDLKRILRMFNIRPSSSSFSSRSFNCFRM